MHLSLLFSVFSTLAAAVTLPFSESEPRLGSLKPRSVGDARNLFKRQSTFSCNNGYFCYDDQSCCGIGCCNTGYTCSSTFTCDPDSSVSTCTTYQIACGSTCCDSGYYCATDYNCYADSAAPATCTASQTTCGTSCCDSGYSCDGNFNCYLPSTSNTCSSIQTVCGSTCCSVDDVCDASSSTCSSKPHKPKSATDSSSRTSYSKKLSGKALAGIVTGVLAGVALVGATVLLLFRRCFGSKKKAEEGAAQEPPAYGAKDKDLEPQVQEVAPEPK